MMIYKLLAGVTLAAAMAVGGVFMGTKVWLADHLNSLAHSSSSSSSGVVIKVGKPISLKAYEQKQVVLAAKTFVKANAGKKSPFDASLFLEDVFAKAGVKLPRTIAEQGKVGTVVATASQLEPGDIVCFDLGGAKHVVNFDGVYLGNDEFAAVTTHGLISISLSNPYWASKFLYGRRVLTN